MVGCLGAHGSNQVLAQAADRPLHACGAVVAPLLLLDGDVGEVQCQIIQPAAAVLATREAAKPGPAAIGPCSLMWRPTYSEFIAAAQTCCPGKAQN